MRNAAFFPLCFLKNYEFAGSRKNRLKLIRYSKKWRIFHRRFGIFHRGEKGGKLDFRRGLFQSLSLSLSLFLSPVIRRGGALFTSLLLLSLSYFSSLSLSLPFPSANPISHRQSPGGQTIIHSSSTHTHIHIYPRGECEYSSTLTRLTPCKVL